MERLQAKCCRQKKAEEKIGLEKELEIEGGRVTYRVNKGEAAIVSGHVLEGRAVLPDYIENMPVTEIEKKAFLSSKPLREIFLPGELKRVGDWAFAYCGQLTDVWLPGKGLSLGKGIFKECIQLSGIHRLGESGQRAEQAAKLLGAVPIKLEADYLFVPQEAGEPEWLSRFDDKLREFLRMPDEDGFIKMVYCGEEDIVANVEFYLAERRRAKARLCFLRLMNDLGLSGEFREELCGYLAAHTLGCDSPAAWEVVFKEHGNQREYYEAFTRAGCLTEENYDHILARMGDQYPEMKGYLMRYQSENAGGGNFFDALSLD